MSPKVCDEFVKIAEQLIDQKLIEPCTSEWCNPVVMVRKEDGSYRLCIDIRKVNEISEKDAYNILHHYHHFSINILRLIINFL